MIRDDQILRGVEKEVARTLPFWRCALDLKRVYQHTPVLDSLTSSITFRSPCHAFPGVDVVWVVSKAVMKVQTHRVVSKSVRGKRERHVAEDSSEEEFSLSKARGGETGSMAAGRSWRGVPFTTTAVTLGTMHFVHRNAHSDPHGGGERSFHIQSVYSYEHPQRLQCVAGVMVDFALLLYGSTRLLFEQQRCGASLHTIWKASTQRKSDVAAEDHSDGSPSSICRVPQRVRGWYRREGMRVLVLGMGGNSMGVALRRLLGPHVRIEVVEIESAVIEACRAAGTLQEDDAAFSVHNQDAFAFLRERAEAINRCPSGEEGGFHFVFMDLFEPLEAQMRGDESLVALSHKVLAPGGMLVMNEHRLPDPKALAPLTELFGDGCVHAVNLHGWRESVVVGLRGGLHAVAEGPHQGGRGEEDKGLGGDDTTHVCTDVSLRCSVAVASVLHDMLEKCSREEEEDGSTEACCIVSPPRSWLHSAKTFGKIPHRCKVWAS